MKNIFFGFLSFLLSIQLNAQIADSSVREVKLQGAVNFRDLGGYTTKDGKKVKMGLLYRSAALNALTDADVDKIAALNIKFDFDFRGPYEVKTAPDKIPTTTTRISLPAGSENVGDSVYQKNLQNMLKTDSFMSHFYTDLSPFKSRYEPLFDSLLNFKGNSNLVFHCTAGKDRTGIAAALILYALGVDKETIYDDYEATNYYRRNENIKAAYGMQLMYKLDKQTANTMLDANRDYIKSTFNQIEIDYGTIENYLFKIMRIDDSKIKLLRKYYTK
jgi:protein-tyrosine phosphatase